MAESDESSSGRMLPPIERHSHKRSDRTLSLGQHSSTGLEAQLVLRSEHELKVGNHSPQPKYLKDLENFLANEVNLLELASPAAQDVKLQAYREVFEYLIEDFKSYKPLLAAIKNEYEMMLSFQKQYIKQLEPLQQMLVTVTEQCDKKIMAIRDEEKREVYNVKTENSKLQSVIDEIRNHQLFLQTQVKHLEQKLDDQYSRYRSEADARKLLVSDINDLRAQQEELIYQQQQASNRDKSEDPAALRQALRTARESERSITNQINDIIANYGDVIPKRDYTALREEHGQLDADMRERSAEFDRLTEQHNNLLESHKQIIKQRDEYYQEMERLRQNATPRPDWPKCSNYITGGTERWKRLSDGKGSDELLGMLLDEFSGTAGGVDSPELFDPCGLAETVPYHLRYDKSVKNRRLLKRDLVLLIKAVWKEKDVEDSKILLSGGERTTLSNFLVDYLSTKFSNEHMIYEWTYNVNEACQRYMQDERVKMFYKALTEELDQELYFSELQSIVSLLKFLRQKLNTEDGTTADLFTINELREHFAEFFNNLKSDEELDVLIEAIRSELKLEELSEVKFEQLFFEGDEGKFGPFIDEFKKQVEAIRLMYIDKILENLPTTDVDEAVTPTDLSSALSMNDDQLDPSRIQSIVFKAYNATDKSDLESSNPINVAFLKEFLKNRYFKQFV